MVSSRKHEELRGCRYAPTYRLWADGFGATRLRKPSSAGRNMVAIMNEALELEIGQKVLEVGAGSGWHACTIAEVIAPSDAPKDSWGHVYTVEIIEGLAKFAMENVEKAGYGDRVTVICRDGSLGLAEKAPYDRILVTAAAPDIPKPLLEQLKDGGILVIPVGGLHLFQTLYRVRKVGGKIFKENLGGVAFVPLTGRFGHRSYRENFE